MNSNQFLSLLKKGNDLQKEDFQQLVKLHGSFPYFQIPVVLAAKYEQQRGKHNSSKLLHIAAILSPDRKRLKHLIEDQIDFFDINGENKTFVKTLEPGSSQVVDAEMSPLPSGEEIPQTSLTEEEEFPTSSISESDQEKTKTEDPKTKDQLEQESATHDVHETVEKTDLSEDSIKDNTTDEGRNEEETSKLINSSHPTDEDISRPSLITSPFGGDEDTRPRLILPDSEDDSAKADNTKEEEKPLIAPLPGPPSSRQLILKQLEDNLARLKSESEKNKANQKPIEEPKAAIVRRRRSGDDLIDSIKKKEKQEIKDTKKKEQNDIIKAFNKKSIKLAAIKENEDVNKLQDLSLPSTKINDRLVSESYAKLLTQQGKKAAAKEIYKKLILKFPQKKAYFADLIQQLEE